MGAALRGARRRAGLTLDELAQRVGCHKSYLSRIENDQREAPPSDGLLAKIEAALGLPPGHLSAAAHWQHAPASVKQQVAKWQGAEEAARVLATAAKGEGLDALFRSGELRKLIERMAPTEPDAALATPIALPVEVPVINSVAAGYPREFTDLGYPARVADAYVRCPDVCDADAFAARVVGASMSPLYIEGDIVIFSPARPVVSGMDCFVRLEPDHETTFKRVYFERGADGAELIRLQPLNPEFAARVVGREQVAGLYAAVSFQRSVG